MIDLFGPLRHINLWSVAAFDKDGDGGGGGGDDDGGSSDGGGTRSEAEIQADINNALKESGGQWTPELNDLVAERDVARGGGGTPAPADSGSTFEFEGPMPDGSAGYTQDVSQIGYDPFTGFLTGDDDDDVGMTPVTPLDTTGGIESLLALPGTGATDVYDDSSDYDYTPATPLDTSAGIENLLPPPPSPPPAVAVDEFSGLPPEMTDPTFTYTPPTVSEPVFEGPMLDGTPGYTQDISQMDADEDTGFITEDRGAVDYTPAPPPVTPAPPPVTPAAPVIITPPTGILTAEQAAAQQAGILAQQQVYQDMLERARAAEVARIPTLPMTPAPVDFVPSQDLRDETGSLLAPVRDLSGVTSIGYDIGQIDPGLARAAGIEAGQPAFGQTTGQTTLEQLYGADITPTLDNLGDLTLGTGMFDEARQLLETRPDLMLAPTPGQTVVATGQVPAGTPGAQAPQDIYMADEVQTLLDASPQARTVYQDLGITRTASIDIAGDPNAPQYTYRDAAGNKLSAQQVADALRSASTTTLPGGYTVIAPLDVTTPTVPAIDLGLTPVDVATPVTVVSGGGGGGGGGTRGGGAGRGDPRDFGFVAEEAAASRGSPAGIEGLLERSPTLGQPATTTVPQASDIIMPGVETSPTVTREPPPPMAPPGGEEAPSVDVTIAPRDEVGGEPDAAEEVEVQVDTGDDQGMGAEEDTGTGREEPGAPGGAEGGEGTGEGVEVDIGGGEDEGAGTGGEGTGTGTGTGTGEGEGEGAGEGPGEGAGEGPGEGTGTGGGEGAGEGTGTGDGTGGEEVEVDVVDEEPPVEEEEEEPPVEEEEPAFECPPGFRRVQMANGGFTCVPTMVRPRVGPYTQTVDVSGLRGRTVFRPGTRRR